MVRVRDQESVLSLDLWVAALTAQFTLLGTKALLDLRGGSAKPHQTLL